MRREAAVNLAGLPALALPAGLSRAGLPIGIQLIAPHFAEERLLAWGRAYRQGDEWRRHRPRGFCE